MVLPSTSLKLRSCLGGSEEKWHEIERRAASLGPTENQTTRSESSMSLPEARAILSALRRRKKRRVRSKLFESK